MMRRLKKEAGRILLFVALIALDQWTKWLAVANLKGTVGQPLLEGVLEFVYTENTGAAFSSFTGMNTILLVVGLLLFCALLWAYSRIPPGKKWRRLKNTGVFVLAGALGNLIDRVFRGFVVDFIYFVPIDFPKFNLADSYLVVSLIVLFIIVCFTYKGDDFGDFKRPKDTPKEKPAP